MVALKPISQGLVGLVAPASAPAGMPARSAPEAGRRFVLPVLAGRFVELSGHGGSALLSAAFRLVLEAQRSGRNAAWVSLCSPRERPRPTPFHAPDVALSGVDLAALPVVLAPGPLEAGRAASHLLRSGAFALVVLDLVGATSLEVDLPLPLQSRLTGLAQTHGSALLALTDKPPEAGSLGSLVSLHARVERTRRYTPSDGGDGRARFEVALEARKDKRHGPGWVHREVFHAPAGFA